MTVFLDTNVLIDFLTARGSFGPNARAIVRMCNGSNSLRGCFSSLSACNIVYILRNHFAGEVLRNQVLALGSILEMIDTRAAEVKAALAGNILKNITDNIELKERVRFLVSNWSQMASVMPSLL